MKKGKVVLVGTGMVGMSMAYSMLNQGGVNELILIDIDKGTFKTQKKCNRRRNGFITWITICTTKNGN